MSAIRDQPVRLVLRHYQDEAIVGVQEKYRFGAKGVILVMPTGAGKTLTATRIAQLAAAKETRTLFTLRPKVMCGR